MSILLLILSSFAWAEPESSPASSTTSVSKAAAAGPTCSTSECHANLSTKKFLHGPMKSKGCTVCHQVEKVGSIHLGGKAHPIVKKNSISEINAECLVCHDEFQVTKTKTAHTAIEKKSCVGCHNPHQSDQKNLLSLDAKKELCLTCHEDKAQQLKTATYHIIDKMEKGCLSCHETHVSNGPYKLLKAKTPEELCLGCHNKIKVSNLANVHRPVLDQHCIKCHDVHGSNRKNILKLEYTKENPELCLTCHGLKSTKFRNGSEDLHLLHLNDTKNKKSCRTCHNPHQSSQEHLINTEFEAHGVLVPMNFKKIPQGGTCTTTCHKTFEYNRAEKVKNESDR